MHWIIQTNIFAEEGFKSLMAAIQHFELPYTLARVVPFVGDIEIADGDELPLDGAEAIVMGSYSLARAAKKRYWQPGAFLDNLDFTIQRKHWGDLMLNYDADIMAFDSVPFQREPFFMRPVHDTKAFTGVVMDWGYYENWRDGLIRMPETADPVNDPLGINVLTRSTPVMVCSKKEIYSETRFWIVDGKPVTWSGYKKGTLKMYTAPEELVNTFLVDFAADVANIWSPNEAYVLDVAHTEDGAKIVEVNNLNSAGWYKGDLQKLVHSLEVRMSAKATQDLT